MQTVWATDLRVAVNQTMTGAGAKVKAAGQEVLDEGTIDAFLAYLNNGLYVARGLDCASEQASASTSPSPSASASASVSSPAAVASTLPITGANTSVLVLGGAVLILCGIGVLLVARSRT
jgi:LPXTG-motif cell wall-anchored protein